MNIRRSLAKIFRSILWMFVTCAFASRLSIAGESGETWDHQLPTLNFSAIKIEADSLVGAWQGISRETLLRSILYVREESPVAGPFKFIKESSTGRELLDSLVAQYPAFKWEQDGSTGVIWIL